jgi:hypothetical protein
MTRRMGIAMLFSLVLWSLPVHAQQIPEAEVYDRTVRWFLALFQSLDPLANELDRRRLIRYTKNLGNSFEAMISDKREIANLLTRNPLRGRDTEDLQLVAEHLGESVHVAIKELTRISFLLKQQYHQEGNQIVADLQEVFFERKAWLGQINGVIERDSPSERLHYSQMSNASAAALTRANFELATLLSNAQ